MSSREISNLTICFQPASVPFFFLTSQCLIFFLQLWRMMLRKFSVGPILDYFGFRRALFERWVEGLVMEQLSYTIQCRTTLQFKLKAEAHSKAALGGFSPQWWPGWSTGRAVDLCTDGSNSKRGLYFSCLCPACYWSSLKIITKILKRVAFLYGHLFRTSQNYIRFG